MTRSSHRGVGTLSGRHPSTGLALLAAAGLVVAIAGCAAGQVAQTSRQQPTVEGANVNVGLLALRNILLAFPDGGRYAKGGQARLELVVANSSNMPDTLVEVRSDAAERVTLSPGAGEGSAGAAASGTATETSAATSSAGPSPVPSATGSSSPAGTSTGRIEVPGNGLVVCRDSGPEITLVGLARDLVPAELISVTFVFERAGEVSATVPVAVSLSPLPPAPTIDIEPTEGAPEAASSSTG